VEDGSEAENSLTSHWHRIYSNKFEDVGVNSVVAPVNLNLPTGRVRGAMHTIDVEKEVVETNEYEVGRTSKPV
jgi:hypothetical protein